MICEARKQELEIFNQKNKLATISLDVVGHNS
jgi:hypothetical protein